MRDKRKARPFTARLSPNGYLRLSSDLIPEDAREKSLGFVVTPFPAEKRLELRIVGNGTGQFVAKRKALYSNEHAKCPQVTVKSALKFMGIRLPKKSKEFPVTKVKNVLTVQF
jgi:hypothetical protein